MRSDRAVPLFLFRQGEWLVKRSKSRVKVWNILERQRRQRSCPEASKRIREGEDAVREKERGCIILCPKKWVFLNLKFLSFALDRFV